MSFQIISVVPLRRLLVPGDWVWIDHTEAGVQSRVSRCVTDKIDISGLILFENDGQRGVDYEVVKHYGLKN